MSTAKRTARFQPLRGNTVGELELAIERVGERLRRAARAVAEGDLDLADDFYQIAIMQLWELDPSRFEDDDENYLWRSMVNRMIDGRRAEAGDPRRPPLALRFP